MLAAVHPLARLLPSLLLASACALVASSAGAQTPAETDRARQAFEEANAAADEDRFADARLLFEESLRILPRAATALNLAQVLRSLGELNESERLVDRILAGEYGAATDTVRERAEALRAQLAPAFAHVTVELEGAERASVRVDEEASVDVTAAEAHELRLDPGSHRLRVRSPDGRSLEREVRLGMGERSHVTLTLEPLAPGVTSEVVSGGEDLTWVIGVVIGVVVVGAGVGIAVGVATAPPTIDTVRDPVWGEATALLRF